MSGRLLAWSRKSNALVPLVPTGMGGGQVDIYVREADADRLAAVPVPGEDPGPLFAKATALAEALPGWKLASVPDEILVQPRDKTTPVAVSMRRMPGRTEEELFFPAERTALGLDWGLPEAAALCRKLAALFVTTEHYGVVQNDGHPGNYLIDLDDAGHPACAYRIDTQSFGFWHKGAYFGCDKTRWEFVPPELQWLGRRPEGLKGYEVPREADRYALAAHVFGWLTGALPWEYAGGEPDPVKRVEKKEFAVVSMPAGAKVPDEVEAAYYGLPAAVTAALDRGLLGDPKSRPTPSEWTRLLKTLAPTRPTWFLPSSLNVLPLVRLARRAAAVVRPHLTTAAGLAALAGAVWCLPSASEPAGEAAPAADQETTVRPLVQAAPGGHTVRTELDIPPAPRRPANPKAFGTLNTTAGR